MAETNAIEIISNEAEPVDTQTAEQGTTDTEAQQKQAEEQPGESTPEGEAEEPEEDKPFTVKIKFLGKEMDIDPTTDESIAIYQKGLNYDHMAEKIKNNPDSKIIADLAKKSGMTTDQYRRFVAENNKEASVRSTAEELREQYPDAPDDLIRRLAEAENGGAESESSEQDARWDAFLEEFPEVGKPEDLPDGVKEALKSGEDPVRAMYRFKLQEAKRETQEARKAEQIAKQNTANRASSTGSLKAAAGSAQQDPEKMDYATYKAWRRSQS